MNIRLSYEHTVNISAKYLKCFNFMQWNIYTTINALGRVILKYVYFNNLHDDK